MDVLGYILLSYFVVASVVAVGITIYDKKAAMHNEKRVPEKVLFLVAALSGCVAMYITMHLIHHKTRHLSFMVGIPAIFAAELMIAIFILIQLLSQASQST